MNDLRRLDGDTDRPESKDVVVASLARSSSGNELFKKRRDREIKGPHTRLLRRRPPSSSAGAVWRAGFHLYIKPRHENRPSRARRQNRLANVLSIHAGTCVVESIDPEGKRVGRCILPGRYLHRDALHAHTHKGLTLDELLYYSL